MQQIHHPPYEGLFITIEGGEGAGKSTLAHRLTDEMQRQKLNVYHTREPGGCELAESIRKLLLDSSRPSISDRTELMLFLAARVQHLEEVILPHLRKGHIVICERFNDSTIAYQGCARHLGMHHVEQICHLACQGITPRCTLFLDLVPELGLKRVRESRKDSYDRVEREHLQFHQEVRQGFLHLADQYPQRITVLDAALPFEQVFQQAWKVLEPLLFPYLTSEKSL